MILAEIILLFVCFGDTEFSAFDKKIKGFAVVQLGNVASGFYLEEIFKEFQRVLVADFVIGLSFDGVKAYDSFQCVRNGYFCVDAKDSKPDALVFNRIVSLKSSFKLPS